tara:strand:+ start:454 stop:894 length:441 start_codon:yes stop_codon:yes gene_type:complete
VKIIITILILILSINKINAEGIDFDKLLKKELNYNGLLSIVICSKKEQNYCTSRKVNIADFEYKEDFQKYKFPEKNEKIVPIYLLFKKYPNKDTLMLAFQFKYLDFKEDNIKIPKLDTVNLARTIEKRKTIYDFNLEEYYGFFYLD